MDPASILAQFRVPAWRCWRPRLWLAIFLPLTGLPAAASELADLQKELQSLRDENGQLRQRLDSQSRSIDALMQRLDNVEKKPAAPPVPLAPAVAAQKISVTGSETPVGGGSGLSSQMLNLRWFGDVDFRTGGKMRAGSNLPTTWSLGQLDLMANSQLSEKMSVMSEIVFQYRDTEVAATTIERLQFQIHASDLFNLRFGRMHTPFGYWNETFHHGTWFQTTVLRPDLLRFHDGGSILPTHSVGIEAYGYKPLEALDVHYTVGIANGRGLLYTDTIDTQDLNNHKAVYGVVSVEPAAVPGLRLGLNTYVDLIPPDPSNKARLNRMDELITGAHAVFQRNAVEFLAEAERIEHRDRVAAKTYTTWGMYAQAAYQVDAFKPYVRFDLLDTRGGDPFYGTAVSDLKRYTAGLRWDVNSWAALKFEYHYIRQVNLKSPNALYTQATFSF